MLCIDTPRLSPGATRELVAAIELSLLHALGRERSGGVDQKVRPVEPGIPVGAGLASRALVASVVVSAQPADHVAAQQLPSAG